MRDLFVLLLVGACTASCISESGSPVDWWVIYKLPSGFSYAYLDVNSQVFQLSPSTLTENLNGALGATLSQVYNNANDVNDFLWAFYNDETPDSSSDTHAHSKGVLYSDNTSGFWLVHSVPKFPPHLSDGYSYSGASEFGQTFRCTSFPASQMDLIGQLFYTKWPLFYESNLPSGWVSEYPNLSGALGGAHTTQGQLFVTNLTSSGGSTLTGIAKSREWGQDLYADGIGATYQSNVYSETWMDGAGKLPSYCTPTYPFDTVNIKNVSVVGTPFADSRDHSKWAVTDSKVICIGGTNRMHSQMARGGGTLCEGNTLLAHTFHGLITQTESC